MMKAEFTRDITGRDLATVALLMRNCDRAELAALGVTSPILALRQSVDSSIEVYAGKIAGKTKLLFGIAAVSIAANHMRPWLLATFDAPDYAVLFMRQQRDYIADWRARFDLIDNYVDVRNTASLAWLKLLGFQFDAPAPYGVAGAMFQRFYLEKV